MVINGMPAQQLGCSLRRFIASTYRAFSRGRGQIARQGNAARAYRVP